MPAPAARRLPPHLRWRRAPVRRNLSIIEMIDHLGNIMPRRSPLRWILPAVVALLWLGLAGPLGSFSGKLTSVQENDSTAFLPDSAESTRVTELQRAFATERSLPVILLWESDDGPLDQARLAAIGERTAEAVG